ncbi:MAG TPA: KpsF/GutQ family sugar-phosphate isomerase, partial [Candidatus Ratteibacteria bacterium]|nr:KpsF/GutQ family sugar-phosphate isomerase [Candidatus Ratteibacteria bacterium]
NLERVKENLGDSFAEAVETLKSLEGKVVITGMGKSGIIGRKIVGTFASIGISSIFLHPGDAVHGDLGVVSKNDVVLLISNSGETDELIRIVPSIKKIGAKIISITATKKSTLGQYSDIVIETGEITEADNFGIIPSSSTTTALVIGDALSLTIMNIKNIKKQDFAFFHPAGNLGKRLMLRVKDIMQTGENIPIVDENRTLIDGIKEINRKNLGFTLAINKNNCLTGIITDGDIRRLLAKDIDITKLKIKEVMIKNPKTIDEDILAVKAMEIMEKYEITALPIVDENKKIKGVVHLHDLLGKKDFGIEY